MKNDQSISMNHREILPTLLEFKEIAHARGLLNAKEVNDYLREEKGAVGEGIISDFLYEEGAADWMNLQNLWLYDGSIFECDSVLFTHHKIHTFEIKHYTGQFTYKNGSCQIGNLKMESDCIQQARKSFLKFRKLCQTFSSNIQVSGALIFSSNKNKVVIESQVEDIHILEMPDLYQYIQRILQEERGNPYPPIDWQPLIQHLKQFKSHNPFYPEAKTKEQIKDARKGIRCAMCKKFNVTFSKHYVECPCGYHESREEAIVRSACEYGILTYNRNFSAGDIHDFISDDCSRSFVQRTLAKHFKMIKKNRYTYYENISTNYPNLKNQFSYEKTAYKLF